MSVLQQDSSGSQTDALSLQRSLDELLAGSPAQCASLSRFDVGAGECRVEATAGATLVARGGLMPIECSTNFATAAGGSVFQAGDLWELPEYDRGWDQVTVAAGLRSTCTVPLTLGSRAVGAVSFSSREPAVPFERTIDAVMSISDRLVLALVGRRSGGRVSSRVLIFVDDQLAAEGLARIAERELDADIVPCTSIDQLAENVRSENDLVLLDSYTHGRRVDEHADLLRRRGVQARMVVVSSYDVEANRVASLRAGAMGYVARDVPVPALGDAILRVGMGETLTSSTPVSALNLGAVPEALTHREAQTLVLLERGLQVKQIARVLGISDTTVKGYQRNVFAKLDVHSTTAAIYVARRSGLLQSLQGVVEAPSPDGVVAPLAAP